MAESISTTMLISDDTCSTDQVSHNKGGGGAAVADPFPVMPILNIPVVDLSSCISAESSPERAQELQKLRSALSSFGCVQLMNHGIANSFLDQLHEVGKDFFALPTEEKLKCSRAVDKVEGYWKHSENQRLEWAERLFLYVQPEDQRKYKFWPQNPQTFRDILHEYTTNMKSLAETVFKAMAGSLNLAENSFLDQYGENDSMLTIFNFYPPCPTPDLKLGAKVHTDGSAITILLQDKEVEGLQVLKDDQWFRVPIVPHALLMNIGDQVEIMSNGVFKSPMHKVVTNSERERMTIAMFYMPNKEKEIGPIEELISEESPRVYKRITNFGGIRRNNSEQRWRPIDEVKL